MNRVNINLLYQTLLKEMGPQGWWPADSKPEIILGAILVQNTNWKNVEKSLINLKKHTDFMPEEIKKISLDELQYLIKPSGFYKNKSQSIKTVFNWFEIYQWDYNKISSVYGEELRSALLKLKGVGHETADVLLVYVFDQPVFIADVYARRLFGWLTQQEYTGYEILHHTIELPNNFTHHDAKEFHGLIDEFGKLYLGNKKEVKQNFLVKGDLLC